MVLPDSLPRGAKGWLAGGVRPDAVHGDLLAVQRRSLIYRPRWRRFQAAAAAVAPLFEAQQQSQARAGTIGAPVVSGSAQVGAVKAQVVFDDAGDKVVAMVVAGVAPQGQAL